MNRKTSRNQHSLAESATRSYEFDHFFLDTTRRLLFCEGEALHVAPKSIETLQVLIERRTRVVETDELMDLLWPSEVQVEENNLNFHISKLRQALGETPRDKRYIMTVPRRGYRFVARVKERNIGCITKSALQLASYPITTQANSFTIASSALQGQSGLNFFRSTAASRSALAFEIWTQDLRRSMCFYQKLGFIVIAAENRMAKLAFQELTLLLKESEQPSLLKTKPVVCLQLQVSDIDVIHDRIRQHYLQSFMAEDCYSTSRMLVIVSPDGLAIRFVEFSDTRQ